MRKVLTLTAVCILIAAVAGAQYKPQAAQPSAPKSPLQIQGARTAAPSSFPRISVEDAMKLYKEDKAVFVDVRSNQQFALGHIKGALSIPGSQIVKRFAEVPTMKTVIIYCACDAEQSSGRAAATLIAHGVKNVWALKGGWDEWKASNGPRAAGPK